MENKLIKKKKLLLTKGNKLQLASICNELAGFYMREGKYELSKNEYENEAKLYKELDKPICYARANRMLGEICTALAEFDEALKYEQIHYDIAKEQKNDLEVQRALASIGRTYLTKAISDPEKRDDESLQLAHTSFLESLSKCEGLKDITNVERNDMRARLYLNIGVVKEHQGNFEGGEKFMKMSIDICKIHDIYDQLQHGFYTLGLLHSKSKNYKQSITNFNYALDVADRLSDKIPPLCATYMSKAEVLIKIGEFASAKHNLIKAHKLQSPNFEERKAIEHTLKVVAAICKAEDSLITLPVNEYKKRKDLYERMGDGLSDLKMFSKAIEYYLKMLESSIACGDSGKDLLPVYVSLAQTYKDNKQYELALEYFEKDYEISKTNPEESCNTLLNIAVILELMKKPYEDVAKIYIKARMEAHATNNMKHEGKVIDQFIRYQKVMGKFSKAEELQKELDIMGYESSDSESEGKDDGGTPDIGNDINIDDLTDISDSSDKEETNKLRQTRKRGRQFVIKKNQKGETALHTACIRGNDALVMSLLDQKHPVNIEDFSGWTPLHEACNHGHLSVVRTLIKHGAKINHRGGKTCEGITPLHDSCVCGHFEIAELLLDNGASPIALDDKGRTPLDCLIAWKNQNTLELELERAYDSLVTRLKTSLEKAGKPINQNTVDETFNAFYEEISSNTPKESKIDASIKSQVIPKKSIYDSLHHSIDIDDDLLNQPSGSGLRQHSSFGNNSFESNRSSFKRNLSLKSNKDSRDDEFDTNSGCNEYKRVMETIRNRVPESEFKKSPKKSKKSSTAFLSDEEVGDNWLDDDLRINQPKKRQRGSKVIQNFIESNGIRSISDRSKKSPRSRPSISEILPEEENTDPFTNKISGYESSDSGHSISSNKRKRSQTSLLESGFSRSNSPLNTFNYNTSPVTCVDQISTKAYKRQQKLNLFVNLSPDSTSQPEKVNQNHLQNGGRLVLVVNVRIENTLWGIPVPTDVELRSQLTIEWLAQEASRRYYKQKGITPTLQLLTKDGAILANEDPLSMVFISETQAEEVQSNIISWNLPPLTERYEEACNSAKIEPCRKIKKCLDSCEETLSLKLADFLINKKQFPLLFRIINQQNNLQQLDLSHNRLYDDGVRLLCSALPSLEQLRSLDISKNVISEDGINFLAEMFTNFNNILLHLNELNINLNNFHKFNNIHIEKLSIIFSKLKLRVLHMSGCCLPENIFKNVIELNLQHVEILDISYNDLNTEDIIKFLSFLNFRKISNLNVSHNLTVSTSGIVKSFAAHLNQYETNNVNTLNFSRCHVIDEEIFDLLSPLRNSQELGRLILTYNKELTAKTLRRLVQHRPSFKFINLMDCTDIMRCFTPFSFSPEGTSETNFLNTLKAMRIYINYETHSKEAECLKEMWEKEWGKRGIAKIVPWRIFNFYVES